MVTSISIAVGLALVLALLVWLFPKFVMGVFFSIVGAWGVVLFAAVFCQIGTTIAWEMQWHAPMVSASPGWNEFFPVETWKMLHP
jgi:hypothetical protein